MALTTTKAVMKRMQRANKSKPVGYKNAKIKKLKGGKGMPAVGKRRGGYGAARANLGFAAASGPIRPVIGRSR